MSVTGVRARDNTLDDLDYHSCNDDEERYKTTAPANDNLDAYFLPEKISFAFPSGVQIEWEHSDDEELEDGALNQFEDATENEYYSDDCDNASNVM
jgi:hypothetical protein